MTDVLSTGAMPDVWFDPAPPRARLAAVDVYLPEHTRSTVETEARLRDENPGMRLPTGLIHRLTGVERVHVRPDGWQTSDLAVAAARRALDRAPGDVDLLVFASASQDLIEPATSHIVAAKLGVACPVMDVKNACNSLVNGMQVADALIRTGQYRRVLVASGEQPSHAVRWRLEHRAQFLRSFPGYTMSDGGAAVVLERVEPDAGGGLDDVPHGCVAAPDDRPGILGHHFVADSSHWRVGTLGTGGSMDPHARHGSYFDMDGEALRRAFLALGPRPVFEGLARMGLALDDLAFVAIHQVAAPTIRPVMAALGVDSARWIDTVTRHGNLASVTLPLQLRLALDRGLAAPGDTIALIGLAGGISLGITGVRL